MFSMLSRRRFLEIAAATVAVSAAPAIATLHGEMGQAQVPRLASRRGWLIYVDARLGSEGDAFRRSIAAATLTSPLLKSFANGGPPLQAQRFTPEDMAYNHLLMIGLPDDPLMAEAWQREAAVQPKDGSIYAFGFGHLRGSIGYLEADRNPFLHSASILRAPYECECVTLTGTDRAGIGLAVGAFLKQGLVNGLVASPGWQRTAPTLLDRDPLVADFILPVALPKTLGSLERIAVTQVTEDEYRGALLDAGVMPQSIWQAKYYGAGQWDGSGQIAAFYNYATGLHRRAYGNSVWAAAFASPSEAAAAAPRIAASARLKPVGPGAWTGDLPPYAWGIAESGDGASTGTLDLHVAEDTILLIAISRPAAEGWRVTQAIH